MKDIIHIKTEKFRQALKEALDKFSPESIVVMDEAIHVKPKAGETRAYVNTAKEWGMVPIVDGDIVRIEYPKKILYLHAVYSRDLNDFLYYMCFNLGGGLDAIKPIKLFCGPQNKWRVSIRRGSTSVMFPSLERAMGYLQNECNYYSKPS